MRIFLDTCALFKLYHAEADTQYYENIFLENAVSEIFLSELTRLEFSSTLWRKVRLAIEKLSKKQKGHDQNIELLFEYIDRLQENTPHASSKGVTVVKGFDVGSKKNN